MMYKSAWLYATNRDFRAYMKERRGLPKEIWRYLGYALFAGTKSSTLKQP
jgi:hypothetical protein